MVTFAKRSSGATADAMAAYEWLKVNWAPCATDGLPCRCVEPAPD